MINSIQSGEVLELTAPYNRDAGQGALIGAIFGVAIVDVDNGDSVDFAVTGVFDLSKAAGDTPSQGSKLYWDDSAKNVTTDSSGNTLIGVATEAADSGDATVRVRLNGSF